MAAIKRRTLRSSFSLNIVLSVPYRLAQRFLAAGAKIPGYNRNCVSRMLKRAICIGFLFAVCGLSQSSSLSSAQVTVNVRPEAALSWLGDAAVTLKARLAPGTQATVWADDSCSVPAAGAQVISGSGTYTIPAADLGAAGKSMVCLSSSDGRLSMNLPAVTDRAPGGAAP